MNRCFSIQSPLSSSQPPSAPVHRSPPSVLEGRESRPWRRSLCGHGAAAVAGVSLLVVELPLRGVLELERLRELRGGEERERAIALLTPAQLTKALEFQDTAQRELDDEQRNAGHGRGAVPTEG